MNNIRHYVDGDGVFIHAGDLEDTIRRLSQEIDNRSLGVVADALHEHANLVREHTLGQVFTPSIFRRLGLS